MSLTAIYLCVIGLGGTFAVPVTPDIDKSIVENDDSVNPFLEVGADSDVLHPGGYRFGRKGFKRWGDILIPENFTFGVGIENVIPYTQFRWPNARVPYVIDLSVAGYAPLILQAMQDYHTKTCVRFVPRTFETNYIRIFAGQGCYSNVGMIGGQQPVSLGQGCMYKGTVVHELGHAVGFFHEQNRSDRDNYLIIYWQNIQQGAETQFFLLKPNENLLLDTFDYNSVMLYGNTAFSKDGRSHTMDAKNGVKLYEPYDKPGLSTSDTLRINKMYNCSTLPI